MRIDEIFDQQIWQIDREAAKKNVKKYPHDFVAQSLRVEIVQKFYLCVDIWYAIKMSFSCLRDFLRPGH